MVQKLPAEAARRGGDGEHLQAGLAVSNGVRGRSLLAVHGEAEGLAAELEIRAEVDAPGRAKGHRADEKVRDRRDGVLLRLRDEREQQLLDGHAARAQDLRDLRRGDGAAADCRNQSAPRMLFADLKASAIKVSVGLAVHTVGKLPLPTTHRFRTSCERWLASTTDLSGSSPMRCVPTTCPAP